MHSGTSWRRCPSPEESLFRGQCFASERAQRGAKIPGRHCRVSVLDRSRRRLWDLPRRVCVLAGVGVLLTFIALVELASAGVGVERMKDVCGGRNNNVPRLRGDGVSCWSYLCNINSSVEVKGSRENGGGRNTTVRLLGGPRGSTSIVRRVQLCSCWSTAAADSYLSAAPEKTGCGLGRQESHFGRAVKAATAAVRAKGWAPTHQSYVHPVYPGRWQPNGYHYLHPPKMRSICRRWFKSCAASRRTNSSTVCRPRTSWTP